LPRTRQKKAVPRTDVWNWWSSRVVTRFRQAVYNQNVRRVYYAKSISLFRLAV
jgi:hypothetical protein